MAGALARLLFPPRCMFCRRVLEREDFVCPRCAAQLPMCGRVRGRMEFYSKSAAPLYYEGTVRAAVLRYKFRGARGYAVGFGAMMAATVSREFPGEYDVITWVPVSARRERKRGFDQAGLLASQTALRLGTRAVPTLRKIRDTPANSGLRDRAARAANILGAYEVTDPAAVAGKRVLLVDDIITTGATFSECARMLLMAGASEVLTLAAAAARPKKK